MGVLLKIKQSNVWQSIAAIIGPTGNTGAVGPKGEQGNNGPVTELLVNGTSVLHGGVAEIELLDLIYPLGSIYLTINSTNPSSYLGGSWVKWGSGRTIVCVNSNDSNFNAVQKLGGSALLQEHKHSISLTSGNASQGHTHSYAHTHGIGHTHGYAHTHGTPETACSVNTKTLEGSWSNNQARFPETTSCSGILSGNKASRSNYWDRYKNSGSGTVGFSVNLTHTHTVTAVAMTTDSQSATTTSSASNVNTTSQNTTTSGVQSANHTHTFTGNTNSTGTGTSGNLQPYITCYMWKRTA